MKVSVLLPALGLFANAVAAHAHGSDGEPIVPGAYRHEHPELDAHLVLAELDSPEISVRVLGEGQAGITPTKASMLEPALIVVQSGGPFSVTDLAPEGLTVEGGVAWAGTSDDRRTPLLAISSSGCGSMRPSSEQTIVSSWVASAVSGAVELLRDGQPSADLSCDEGLCEHTARSAIGVSDNGYRLVQVVVDGPPVALGMTAIELASLMREHGAYAAILLEGGASAALAIGGALASSPSDGLERLIANVVALRYSPVAGRFRVSGVACSDFLGLGCLRIPWPNARLESLSGFPIPEVDETEQEGGYYETDRVLGRTYRLFVRALGFDEMCVHTVLELSNQAECLSHGRDECVWTSVRLLPHQEGSMQLPAACPPIACGPPVEMESITPSCEEDAADGGASTDAGIARPPEGCGCRSATGKSTGSAALAFASILGIVAARRRRA